MNAHYNYWWTILDENNPATTGSCTSNIKDPDYTYVLNDDGVFEPLEVVADVPYKEVKDEKGE